MNRILVVNGGKTELNAFGRIIPITCKVRNLENGERHANEVVRTEPTPGVPYSPVVFPSGAWKITAITDETHPDLAPYFIATDAWAYVPVWAIDAGGLYVRKTGQWVKDSEYGVHNSKDPHTLGCLRVTEGDDLLFLVETIWDVWGGKEPRPGCDTVELDVA